MPRAVASAKADDKRRRLTAAGLELLEELPYAEITVALIAERASMARSLVFYYFDDKDTLLREAVREFLDQLRGLFAANDRSAAPDPMTWLRREVDIFLDMMATHPQVMATIVGQGWEAEQDGSGTSMMDFTADRVHRAFDLPPGDPVLDAALRSWGHHCVDLASRTQHHAPHASSATVAALLIAQLEAVFATLGLAADTETNGRSTPRWEP